MEEKNVRTILTVMREKRMTTVAGAWVFYFLTALLPMVFLFVTAFAVFGVRISAELVGRLPEQFRVAGEAIISTAENASRGITVFFVLTVLFSGSALLNQMSKDGEFIYDMKTASKNGILRRLWAITALCVLFVIFLGAAFLVAFKNIFFNGFFSAGGREVIISVIAFSFVILLSYAIIILLNRFISPVKQKFSTLAFGSFISLAIIVLGTIGFIFYLKFFDAYNAFYGSLAAIIVFIIWAYIAMSGLVFGAMINSSMYKRLYGGQPSAVGANEIKSDISSASSVKKASSVNADSAVSQKRKSAAAKKPAVRKKAAVQ